MVVIRNTFCVQIRNSCESLERKGWGAEVKKTKFSRKQNNKGHLQRYIKKT
jgi:hypothetical protein